MNPVVYLLMPVGLSVVGCAAVALLQRHRTPSVESNIDAFRQARDILRLGNRPDVGARGRIILPLFVETNDPPPRGRRRRRR